MDDLGLHGQTRHFLGLLQQFFVKIKSRSHLHKCASFVQTWQVGCAPPDEVTRHPGCLLTGRLAPASGTHRTGIRKEPVAVVWRILVRGNRVQGPLVNPDFTIDFVGVVAKPGVNILVAARSDEVDMTGGVGQGANEAFFAQRVRPEPNRESIRQFEFCDSEGTGSHAGVAFEQLTRQQGGEKQKAPSNL